MAVNVVGRDEGDNRRRGRGGRDGEGGRASQPRSEERSRPSRSERPDRARRPERREPRRGGDRPIAEYDKGLEENIRLFIAGLLERMGFPCTVTASFADGAYMVQVDAGDNDSLLIGRKGETLDALQHVAYKMASRGREESATIKIDISGYRERREGALADEAREMAMDVKDNGRTRQTEPLRAAERRIVHRAVTDIEGVMTRAIGTGLVKKVVIQLEREGEAEIDDQPRETRRERPRAPEAPAPSRSPEPGAKDEVLDFVSSPAFSAEKAPPTVAEVPAPAAAFGRRTRPSKKRRR